MIKNNAPQGTIKGISLMLFSSICVCIGQLFWKLSNGNNYVYLLFGFLLYGIGSVTMILAYKHGEVSKLQPILAINYVLATFFGFYVFDEAITWNKIVGIIVIIFGVLCISFRGKK